MRQQYHPRRSLVGIELAQKRFQYLGRIGARAGPGIEVAVAPVLVRADEEHLYAGLPAIHVERDDVGLGHAARVDGLVGLNLGQRPDPVAQGGGAFKLHRV